MTENKKFVDDLTILEDVQLKDNVVEKAPSIGPLSWTLWTTSSGGGDYPATQAQSSAILCTKYIKIKHRSAMIS